MNYLYLFKCMFNFQPIAVDESDAQSLVAKKVLA